MSDLALQLIAHEKKEKTGKLDLGKCGLTQLPKELFELDWLEELTLSNWRRNVEGQLIESSNSGSNNLLQENLPEDFKKLKQLKQLYLRGIYDIEAIQRTDNWAGLDVSILGHLTSLQFLDLSQNKIIDYSFLENLTSLQSLNLIDCEFFVIRFLENLTSLQSLDLSANEIKDISNLINLISLEDLNLRYNRVKDLSPLEKLTNLKSLKLTANQFSDIRSLEKLSDLQTLDLSASQLSDYSSLGKLTSLQTLRLGDNYISDILFLEKLTNLQSLNLWINQITDHSVLENLTNLQCLDLSHNQIKGHIVLESLTNLQSLTLHHNKITDIRFSENFTNLQSLDLSFNQITDIGFLENLTGLQSLNLRYNQITDTRFSENLTNLQFLDLSNNKIKDISSLEKLTNLQSLDLNHNQITDISSLEKLTNLQSLDLNLNPITDLTYLEKLINLPHLLKLKLFGIKENNLNIPVDQFVGDNSLENLRGYFASIQKGATHTREVPVILVGNATVGKTSLREFICHQIFPPKEDYSTHGVAPVVWVPESSMLEGVIQAEEDYTFQFYFWDFGGQEYYHATHRLFFSHHAIYVLLWEQKTNLQGVEKIKIRLKNPDDTIVESELPVALFPYTYWLQTIRSFAYDPAEAPVILVQNKLDVAGNEQKEYPGGDFRKQYGISEVFHLSIQDAFDTQPIGMPYQSYENFLRHLLWLSQKHIHKLARQTEWEGIKTTLQQRRGENIWTKAEFLKALQTLDPDIQENSMLSYGLGLHAMGFIFYYPDDPLLSNHVFINPDWVVKNIYGILDENALKEGGKFDRQKLVNQLGEEQADLFIALMKKFELIFENKEESVFIAPQYLPETCTDKPTLLAYQAALPEEASLIIHFPEFMPPSLIQRLIVEFGDKAIGKVYWKYGGLFLLENRHVLIESQPSERNLIFKAKDNDRAVLWIAFKKLREKTSHNNQLYISLDHGKHFLKIADIIKQINLGNPEAKVETLDGEPYHFKDYIWLFDAQKPQIMKDQKKALKVFVSYSHDDIEFRKELQKYLINLEREGIIEIWQDSLIKPGELWDNKIKAALESADIIILLVSQTFIASNYVHEVEMRKSLEKVETGSARIIPVLVKNCDWKAWKVLPEDIHEDDIKNKKGRVGSYQFFPMDKNQRLKAVNRWKYREDVWTALANIIRAMKI